MFKFASGSKKSPSMNRSLNLPSTPHLPDEDETMPTPTYEQPGDRSIKHYKKVVLAIASLAVVGTVAALALYNPNASTTNASVGASVVESSPAQLPPPRAAHVPSIHGEEDAVDNLKVLQLGLELMKAKHNAMTTGELDKEKQLQLLKLKAAKSHGSSNLHHKELPFPKAKADNVLVAQVQGDEDEAARRQALTELLTSLAANGQADAIKVPYIID
ncbi:hypothetical protein H310_04358 [Aphanomyces invadans]|uniref:Uncharacterized protein n=1 Tax=Aphanomyces invadans TaxID=157072 RepID=A0A024UEB6_9STRA|nr:hypothetical protein H310_04358 [Aphanomyces invadans]ETW03943.1 hypothetical protein H310_04358 [Aphanomyces invadans]|eukprot:XP_008866899.1 hypothetical protein H310_04358 [Aphanomyces invadans]